MLGCAQVAQHAPVPMYVQNETLTHPAETNGLTLYPANGPYGGKIRHFSAVGDATHEGLAVSTSTGRVFVLTNKDDWLSFGTSYDDINDRR